MIPSGGFVHEMVYACCAVLLAYGESYARYVKEFGYTFAPFIRSNNSI